MFVSNPSSSNAAKPALFANSSTKPDTCGSASPNVVSNAERASPASEAKSTNSLPTVPAATPIAPIPTAAALPIPAATLPKPCNAFYPFVNDLTNWSVLPIIAIDTFFSNAII